MFSTEVSTSAREVTVYRWLLASLTRPCVHFTLDSASGAWGRGSNTNEDMRDGRTDRRRLGPFPYWRACTACTCFSAGITGMTCREVADTSLSDLTGLAQYCSISLRSQLRKQHSSTIPRFWVRRLLPLLVGLPGEEHNKGVEGRQRSDITARH